MACALGNALCVAWCPKVDLVAVLNAEAGALTRGEGSGRYIHGWCSERALGRKDEKKGGCSLESGVDGHSEGLWEAFLCDLRLR